MDNTYVSKDNGLTWTKRVGNSLTRSVYGGRFVDVGTSLSLITKRNQRTDGSSISPDVITIGHEGATTVIGDSLIVSKINATTVNVSTIGYGTSNTLSIASNVNVSMGSPTTVLSFTTTSVEGVFGRIAFGGGRFVAYGYLGKLYYSTNGTTWTLGTYPTVDYGARILLYTGDRFLFFSETSSTIMYTSMDGVNWNNTGYTTTAPLGQVNRGAAGNNIAILAQYNTGNISVSTNNTGVTWTNISLSGIQIYQVGFGRMSTGTNPNVFLAVGPNAIKRADKAVPNASGDWLNPTNTPSGNWWYIGFGNDTFMITSSDSPGKLSISTNGGLAWSVPIDFGIKLKQPVYFEGEWYIGSDTYMMVSKNNGLTWEKKIGRDCETFASGNSLLVGINDLGGTNMLINLIGIKKTRDDGSLITSDTITLNNPITIGYTIPMLNNQLGYYARSTYTGSGINCITGVSFCPIGPLVPGLYQANVFIMISPNYHTPNFNFDVLGRTTPFVDNTTVTGENIVYDKDGLHWNGYREPYFDTNGNIDFNISGFINLKPSDVLQGVTVSYFCVRVNCQVQPVNINRLNFSVVRIG